MQVISVALAFRYFEVVIDCINLGLYYGSDTQFMLPSDPKDCGYMSDITLTLNATASDPKAILNDCFNTYQPGDGFGEFVLIAGFILAVIILALSIVLEADKKYNLFVLGYNAVFFVFFLAAGVVILNTWSGNMYDDYIAPFAGTTLPPLPEGISTPLPIMDTFNTRRACALAVGSFCIIQCVVLIAGGFFIFKQKKDD